MRRAQREGWPARFTIYSRNELNQAMCQRQYPNARYILGDVCDIERLTLAMIGHKTVIHAAALKFIPEGEFNASEVVRVNIDGARSVVSAARAAGVFRVVGVSTDKAAQPINIYGMSKAVMERLFAEIQDTFGPTFTTCRYGNVIGSTGSVIPVMAAQLAKQGLVSVTNHYMTRFWMSVDQAVDVILGALHATPGSTVIPAPRAANMHSIAHAVLRDETCGWGGVKDADVECHPQIKTVGRRPGEKMDEDLVASSEMCRTRPFGTGLEILPPGNENYAHEAPSISSNMAEWLTYDELVAFIDDAATV